MTSIFSVHPSLIELTKIGSTKRYERKEKWIMSIFGHHQYNTNRKMVDVEGHGGSSTGHSVKSHNTQDAKAQAAAEQEKQPQRRSRLAVLLIAVIVAVIVLALGLGLGLGLGLRNNHNDVDAAATTSHAHVDALSSVDAAQQMLSASWDLHASPQIREFNWTVTQTWGAPGGNAKQLLLVNGISPGPLVEANVGDRILVHVTNKLDSRTAIHWHGQYQNGTNAMDGTYGITECGIAPGQTFTYDWTVQNVGTYWWHAHHGLQYSDGLYGPLILHSPHDTLMFAPPGTNVGPNSNSEYDGDQIIMAADLYPNPAPSYLADYQSVNGPPGGQLGDEPVPSCGVVNGLGICAGGEANARTFNLTNNFQAGKRYRFRLINTGSLATIRFALDGHTMTVIEADGTPVEPQEVQSLNVMIAQRYSVLITMDQQPAAYRFHAELLTDMFAYSPADLVTDQYAILRYAGVNDTEMPAGTVPALPTGKANITEALDDTTLKPLQAQTPPAATKQDTLIISVGLASDSMLHAFLNDSSWTATAGQASLYDVVASQRAKTNFTPEQLVLTNDEIAVWDLIINNEDDGEHPVHLHGYNPWILGQGQGHFQYGSSLDLQRTFDNPMRRDVFSVPTYGWTAIRVVLDNPGIWALHCHIAWHMEIGFLSQINVLPGKLAMQSVNAAAASQCGKSSLV